MIVYVESNFILELAYLQEEYKSCEEILELVQESQITLVLPVYSVGEPYDSWVRRSKQRLDLHERLSRELIELSRSKPYVETLTDFQEITKILVESGEKEKEELDNTISKVLKTATIIPIDREVIKAAIGFQKTRNLSPQDSIVYASVLSHLSGTSTEEQKCFITKNSKDFANPDIYTDLEAYCCKLLTKFVNGVGYTKKCLKII